MFARNFALVVVLAFVFSYIDCDNMPSVLFKSQGKYGRKGHIILMSHGKKCTPTLLKSDRKKGDTLVLGGQCAKKEEVKKKKVMALPHYIPYPVVTEHVPYPVPVKETEYVPVPYEVTKHVPYPVPYEHTTTNHYHHNQHDHQHEHHNYYDQQQHHYHQHSDHYQQGPGDEYQHSYESGDSHNDPHHHHHHHHQGVDVYGGRPGY